MPTTGAEATSFPALPIDSLDQLAAREAEIVARINQIPSGGMLFLADPLRLLREVGVQLSPAASDALQNQLGPTDLAENPLRSAYDDIRRSPAQGQAVTVTVRGILPKRVPGN